MSRVEIKQKFDAIVAFSEVERFLDTPVKHYSSGMYVRLAFAVAAHLEPEILIVDEVLAVGDAAFQKKCLGKLRDVAQGEGRTVLFVSHNLSAVRQLCTSAILLSSGRLIAFDRTSSVLDLYVQGSTRPEKASLATPSPELLDRAYVTGASIETLDGNSPVVIPVGVPWCAKIRFRVARVMSDFVAAIGITMNDGTAIQTVWAPPRRLDPGDYVAVFTADRAILAVGSYLLSAGLTEKDQSLQQLEVGRLEIGADGAAGYFQMVAGVGLVLNSMAVEIHPSAP
jgi:lipopolysaccharide transport system ATP-binding protein